MSRTRILLVDDHQIVRDGIKSIIQKEADMEVVGETSKLEEIRSYINDAYIDLILMDISMPQISGIEITKILFNEFPKINVIMLSMYINEEFVLKSIESGAKGYLSKNTSKHELLKAIRTVSQGGEYFSTTASNIIVNRFIKNISTSNNEIREQSAIDSLSKREIEILKLYVDGFSNHEIGEKLYISPRTVESHKNHIMLKLELKSPVDLIKFAIKYNIAQL